MASTNFVRDTLTKWNLSELIKHFEAERMDEESFLLLTEGDITELIPTMGLRLKFKKHHKELIMPSTSMERLPPGKRILEEDDAKSLPKKQKCYTPSGMTASFDSKKTTVKKIMQSVRSKIDDMPSPILTAVLRKMDMLENSKKVIVGVFGRSGAGKSSLINTILNEPKLLPSGCQGSCTSVMIQVKANMIDHHYTAEIEFITMQDLKHDLLPQFHSSVEEDDEDKKDYKAIYHDVKEKIKALFGRDCCGKGIEDLINHKNFMEIPEFQKECSKVVQCDTAEELSEKITSFTRSDNQSVPFKRQYWPLVKCLTIRVPNCKELLEHVVLVDLPGSGDCNKSKNEMWKSFLGKCSAVWIVSDISRAKTEFEPWEILDSTVSRLGPGGECRSISFICTKTDIIDDNQKDDPHTIILTRNAITKENVREIFNTKEEVKKHFSCGEGFFRVFTVSSKEYRNRSNLKDEETEIPKLQEFLRNLNDHHTRTSDYISGAHGILSLIQGAKKSDMTNSNEEVCKVLEQRLKNEIQTLDKFMEKIQKKFNQLLSEGVNKSNETWEELINKVINPSETTGSAYHRRLKSLCENDGIFKPKGKNTKEININEILASTMRHYTDKEFTNCFPNDNIGPIRAQILKFTLDTNSLVKDHQNVSLHLTFLETEENKLKTKLICDLLDEKKKIYGSLSENIKTSMHISYARAAENTGKGTLKRMKDELRQHVQTENIFQKAKDAMLASLNKLKKHILSELERELQQSIEISLKTPNSTFLPDITEDYINIKKLMP
ncbi:hypothetical protein UPYG_G00107600 [Umbra pygmaea]|uniref:Dynamin N-terminal domain-containing protein n=1 Tax=Umbra pygmaea TaxID=75934 RepID=A0ABD0X282_UMBPY